MTPQMGHARPAGQRGRPSPAPDHAPVLLSVVVLKTTVSIQETVTLRATAVDIDGDPITYAWTSACPTTSSFGPSLVNLLGVFGRVG